MKDKGEGVKIPNYNVHFALLFVNVWPCLLLPSFCISH